MAKQIDTNAMAAQTMRDLRRKGLLGVWSMETGTLVRAPSVDAVQQAIRDAAQLAYEHGFAAGERAGYEQSLKSGGKTAPARRKKTKAKKKAAKKKTKKKSAKKKANKKKAVKKKPPRKKR